MLAGSQSPHWICTSLRLTNIASPKAYIGILRLRYRSTATAARSLSTQLGFTRVGHLKLSKSDRSDFDGERVGVRGYAVNDKRYPLTRIAARPDLSPRERRRRTRRTLRFRTHRPTLSAAPCEARHRAAPPLRSGM